MENWPCDANAPTICECPFPHPLPRAPLDYKVSACFVACSALWMCFTLLDNNHKAYNHPFTWTSEGHPTNQYSQSSSIRSIHSKRELYRVQPDKKKKKSRQWYSVVCVQFQSSCVILWGYVSCLSSFRVRLNSSLWALFDQNGTFCVAMWVSVWQAVPCLWWCLQSENHLTNWINMYFKE